MEWRETTHAVLPAMACRATGEQATRFATYMATLDQEQTVAASYVESNQELERSCPMQPRIEA